ncbi:MAG: hypothetical protein A2514_04185 [Gammaproteobacteria bacterium RIFOXYD12_FULL_61_37]|nr:MAG: hypothetical protein A2514_04185 [Gammaproteobacteria bacterium RIFOXYD12_FULL_61_37]
MPDMTIYRYQVSIQSVAEHLFRVRLDVPPNLREKTILSLPAWIPGSYKIRDFARHIVELSASDGCASLVCAKLDKQRWCVHNGGTGFELSYLVYACDMSVRGAHLDGTHAYFNGPTLLLRPEWDSDASYELELIRPEGDAFADWRVYTALPAIETGPEGYGRYGAVDYAQLIDCPVEMGHACTSLFSVAGVPHRLVVSGRHPGDLQEITQALKSICSAQVALFGELPLDDQYLFLLQLVGNGYGGLEHRNSSSLICSRADLENPDKAKPSEGYRQFLALCSHEYFHLWNGKRIFPEQYRDPDLSREVHSELLWVVEGITSYYDELALVRAEVVDESAYLDMLAQNLTRYYKGWGRLHQSVADSSFDAWTKFYQQDENAPNAIVSYYVKGGILVMMLDLAIRAETGGEFSFDHVMRYLWCHYGKPGIGIPEDAMPGIIERAVGIDLGDLLHSLVHTTEEIDARLAELLASVGVRFRLRPPRRLQDKGGFLDSAPTQQNPPPWLGVNLRNHVLGAEVLNVYSGSPAAEAGLSSGDVLIALNGFKLEQAGFDEALRRVASLQEVPIHFFRGDELRLGRFTPHPGHPFVAEIWLDPDASDACKRARNTWLHLS